MVVRQGNNTDLFLFHTQTSPSPRILRLELKAKIDSFAQS